MNRSIRFYHILSSQKNTAFIQINVLFKIIQLWLASIILSHCIKKHKKFLRVLPLVNNSPLIQTILHLISLCSILTVGDIMKPFKEKISITIDSNLLEKLKIAASRGQNKNTGHTFKLVCPVFISF